MGQWPSTLFGRLGPGAKKKIFIYITQVLHESSIWGQPIWDWVIVQTLITYFSFQGKPKSNLSCTFEKESRNNDIRLRKINIFFRATKKQQSCKFPRPRVFQNYCCHLFLVICSNISSKIQINLFCFLCAKNLVKKKVSSFSNIIRF